MSSSDEEDNVDIDSGFETTRIRDMQRVMEPLEMAVRNSLTAINYEKDTERAQTRDQFYRWLSTVATLRSRVENQTRWAGSGFGKLLKLAHSMRVTRIDEKHKKKGWLRHDACKCQVCGTKEHECTYVIELCGSCEEEEDEEDGQMRHSFHADDWLRVDVKDLTRVWERYRAGYEVLFQDSLLTRMRRTKSMPSEYLGMFATGDTCLKRAMAAFQLQTLPLEICYRADMVAEEATLELRKETRDKHAMLDPEELVNCDPEDAIKVLSRVQKLERAVVAIDQGKAQLVKLDIEMMPEMWSQIDEAKAVVGALTFRAYELEDNEVERKTYLMCGEIADQSLARFNGEDVEESDGETSKGSRSASSTEWGDEFKRKNPTRKARRTAPQASRGRDASNGQAKTKQSVLGASMRTRQSKSLDDEDEDDEEVQVCKRVKRPQRAAARRHASLAESSDEEDEEEEAVEEVVEEEEEEDPFGADAPAPDPTARASGMRIPGPNGESGSLPSRKRVIEDCYRQASAQSRLDPSLSMLLAHAALTIQELDGLTKRLRAERE